MSYYNFRQERVFIIISVTMPCQLAIKNGYEYNDMPRA